MHSVWFLCLTHKRKLTLKVSRNDIDFLGDDCPGFTFCQKVFARPQEREVVNYMKFEICIYRFSPFSIFQFVLAYLIILTKFENFLWTNICSLPFETIWCYLILVIVIDILNWFADNARQVLLLVLYVDFLKRGAFIALVSNSTIILLHLK